MKRLLLATAFLLASMILEAQVNLLSEDFSGTTGTTPPTGWIQDVITGDPNVDLWSFANPGMRALTAPFSSPVAIFDSDNYSNNSQAEDVALESPQFSTLGQNTVFLEFDHYFRALMPSAYHVEVFNGSSWVSVLSGTAETANPEHELINVSAQIANIPNAAIRFRYEGNYTWYWIIDNISVFSAGNTDIRVSAIDSLNSSCSFATNEKVSVQIENLGTSAQSSFDLAFSLNGAAAVIESYNGPAILPGATGTYTFSNTIDLSLAGTYNLKAYTILTGDANNSNDTTSNGFQNLGSTPNSLPYFENFDSFTTGTTGVLVNGWTNVGDYDWWANSGTTPTSTTGPSGDNTSGTGIYLYTEATSQASGDHFILRSPCIDLSANAFLSYHYHMFGPDMGSLEVFVVANGVRTRIDSIGGQQQSNNSDLWRESIIDLASFNGETILLEFQATIGGGFDSDFAIDDVSVFIPSGKDLAITSRLIPQDSVDCFTAMETVAIAITNNGADTLDFSIDSVLLNLILAGSNTGAYPMNLNSGKLAPLQQMQLDFTGVDLSNPGITSLRTGFALAGDVQPTNDSIRFELQTIPPFAIPFFENFDGFTVDTFGVFPTGWRNLTTASRIWFANNGNTITPQTGPNGDHTTGNGVYLYTEATLPAIEGDIFRLQSPCVDLSSASIPELSYYYHMFGAGIGRLDVFLLANGIATQIDSIVGQQQSSSFDPFDKRIVDLSSFSGIIRIEFRATRGPSVLGDIAIDDIVIRDASRPDLALVNAFNANGPFDFGCFSNSEAFSVEVKNNGDTLDLAMNPAKILIKGNGANSILDSIILNAGFFLAGESRTLTFNNLNLGIAGNTDLQFTVSTSIDPVRGNDSLKLNVLTQGQVSAFPYSENFDNGNGGFAAGGERSSWALGMPDKTVIRGTTSGSAAWTTGGLGTSSYNINENSAVYSPCFDFRNAPGNLHVLFSYWINAETNFDGAVMQTSIDSGQTWQNVGMNGDPNNWYNSNSISANPGGQSEGWTGNGAMGSASYLKATHQLTPNLIGQADVRFRLAFAADSAIQFDGFAFDDFVLASPPVVDLGNDFATFCNGSSLDAGNSGSSYLWSTGDTTQVLEIKNDSSLTFEDSLIFVKVTNEFGLSTTDSIIIDIATGSAATVSGFQLTDAACFNDSTGNIDIEVSGAAGPFTFLWSNGATTEDLSDVPVGTYSVFITDSLGCSFESADFEVAFVDSLPEIPRISQVGLIGSNVSFETDMIDGGGYLWDFGDNSTPSTEQNPTHLYVNNGIYVVTLTVINDCGSTLAKDTVFMGTVGLETALQPDLKVFPNPNRGQFSIKLENINSSPLALRLRSMNGAIVHQQELPRPSLDKPMVVSMSKFIASGVYILEILQEGRVYRERIRIR
ncbi:MAG: PKD domain-containing protein [Bacteroidia bacterium]|nr:PKD domain-containing protein [Bacteroidia bacterium]